MNKKFLSAILFGALALASTGSFVSCKDYDDDIKNLQTQINASSKDLADKVSALNTAISAAQSAAEAKAAAAQTAADKALKLAETAVSAEDLEKKLNDLAAKCATKDEADAIKVLAEAAATKTELAEAVKAVEAKIDAAVAETAAAKADIAALQEKVAEVEAAIAKAAKQEDLNTLATKVAALEAEVKAINDAKVMVTEVSLIDAYTYNRYDLDNRNQGYGLNYNIAPKNLGFKAVTEKTTVFGKGLPGELTFDATKSHSIQKANIIVRVNPTNATLAKEDIKLINSKGEALDLIEVVGVEPCKQLLTKAVSNSGLWTITVQAKEDVTYKALYEGTTIKDKDDYVHKISYAVAIGDETRSVVSTYDLTATPGDYDGNSRLDFYAEDKDSQWKSVSSLKNRFVCYSDPQDLKNLNKDEYVWYKKGYTDDNGQTNYVTIPDIAENIVTAEDVENNDKLHQNVDNKYGEWTETDSRYNDARWYADYLVAEVNKPINLVIAANYTNNGVPVVNKEIAGFYVTLDERNAKDEHVAGSPNELNAWKSYEIEGLNVVQTGNTGSITVKSASANGAEIGFRVYAVNLDGTLLDPDGRAFYVYLGNTTAIGTVPTQTIKATTQFESKTTADFLADFKEAMAGVKNAAYHTEIASRYPTTTYKEWENSSKPQVLNKDGVDIYENINAPTFQVWVKENGVKKEVKSSTICGIDLSKVTEVWYQMGDATQFVDGGTYEQKMKIYKTVDNTEVLVKTITVSFTKVMPSEAPEVNYITGQDDKMLLAPIANPTKLADYSISNFENVAAINLNNVFYELAKKRGEDAPAIDGSIKFVVDKSAVKNDKKPYTESVSGYNNVDDGTNLVIELKNGNNDEFKAITDGSEHTIQFFGYYPNISYRLNSDKTGFSTDHSFATDKSKDFAVTYNCWDKFTTWSWTEKAGVMIEVDTKDVVLKDKFNHTLQWTPEGITIAWPGECIIATNSKGLKYFNTSFDQYALNKVVDAAAATLKLVDVKDPGQINNYFAPTWDDEKGFVFTAKQNSSPISGKVEQNLVMETVDAFGHKIELNLGKVWIVIE